MTTVRNTRTRRAFGVVLAVAAVLGALASLGLERPGTAPGPARTGDAGLVADLEAGIADARGLGALSAARIAGGRTVFAGLGAVDGRAPTPDTPYELGSVTKTWTGMLLADAADRGELALTDRVDRHLPELAGAPVGEVTLEELATHTSGLPTLPAVDPLTGLRNVDPYGSWRTGEVIAAARGLEPTARGSHRYSNLGMALAGHAVARAAGAADWPALLRARLLEPLGMTDTSIVPAGGPEPAGAAPPHRANGWPAPWWTGDGFAPAGSSTRSTAADLARFAAAVLDGSAPGLAALTPRRPSGPDESVGLAWITQHTPAGTSVWHNGGTAGSSTMLAIDPVARTAVLVLNNSARGVEVPAWRALFAGSPAAAQLSSRPAPPTRGLIALAVGLVLVGSMLHRALRGADRVGVLAGIADGAAGLVLTLVHGPWEWLPGWLWGALAGAALPVAVLAARRLGARLGALPTWPPRRTGAVLTAAVSGAVLVGVLLTA